MLPNVNAQGETHGLASARLKHIEFVRLEPERALAVLVAEDGQVGNRVLDLPIGLPAASLTDAANFLNAHIRGQTLAEAKAELENEAGRAELDALTQKIVAAGLACWSDWARAEEEERRLIVRVRSVQANNVTIILSVASLVPLIDLKLAELRDQRPNHPNAQTARDEAIARYENIKRDLQALQGLAIEIKAGNVGEKALARVTTRFMQGIRNWWEIGHLNICSKTYDATLFVSCVSLCSLVGCGGTAAVAISGALAGGKPVIEALRSLPKRLFK